MLKGNGYGLGVRPMAELCLSAEIRRFAVTELSEALTIRELCADAQILLLRPTTDPEEMQRLLSELALQLEAGSSLSDAMVSQGVFSCEVTGLVRAGEKTGRLEEALRSLAEYYEDRVRITRQLRSALAYPCLLLMLLLSNSFT